MEQRIKKWIIKIFKRRKNDAPLVNKLETPIIQSKIEVKEVKIKKIKLKN